MSEARRRQARATELAGARDGARRRERGEAGRERGEATAGARARRSSPARARRGDGGRARWSLPARARRGGAGHDCGGIGNGLGQAGREREGGDRDARFSETIFVGLSEADENIGRPLNYFRRPGSGRRKYAAFSSVMRPTKISSLCSSACRRNYSQAHENTLHFRRSRGRRK
jgi:hypothetical protein